MSADIGKISVNGHDIPSNLFRGLYELALMPENNCPPISDTRVRDRVIRMVLTVQNARADGIALPEQIQAKIDKHNLEISYQIKKNGDPAIASYLAYATEYRGYLEHFPVVVQKKEIVNAYEQYIKEKDPRFTDRKIFQLSQLYVDSAEDGIEARNQLLNGTPLTKVVEMLGAQYYPDEQQEWYTTDRLSRFKWNPEDLVPGGLIGPSEGKLLLIDAVEHRTRLELDQRLNERDSYVYKEIESELKENLRTERDTGLWESGDVRENDLPIELSTVYPSCNEAN
ncbi:MAG: hypothetical protein KTR32_42970 [Granulosicoccus sp.]|nr:hypothetical protein [Granulosicoccus sp.]